MEILYIGDSNLKAILIKPVFSHIFGIKLKTPFEILRHYSPHENVCKTTRCIKIKSINDYDTF